MSQENNPAAEPSSARPSGTDAAAPREAETVRKPFVEPSVSVPLDVLEATAFFQGSAALDIADL